METTVEIRYAGVVVGRSTVVRDLDEAGGFIGFSEPLPVGTPLALKVGDALKEARVVEVMESADAATAGMRVRFGAHAAASASSNGKPPTDGVPERMGDEGSDNVASESSANQVDGGGGGGRRRRKRR